jgi:hypothetical protein
MDPFIAVLIILIAPIIILACLDSELSREAEQATLLYFTGGRSRESTQPELERLILPAGQAGRQH